MQFTQITSTKYAGTEGYGLVKTRDGQFAILLNGKLTEWGNGFSTVKAAELYLENHDYRQADEKFMPMSMSDLQFISDMYGLDDIRQNEWKIDKGSRLIANHVDGMKNVTAIISSIRHKKEIADPEELISYLDEKISDDGEIFSSVIYRGTSLRAVLARSGRTNRADQRKSAKEIAKNLVRVKSSNVWAYGVEIKEAKDKEGDVYVQFKGKNGGPGDIYKYYSVPLNVWRKMLAINSKGHGVWKYLRNNYLYSKLTGDKKGKLKNAVNNF